MAFPLAPINGQTYKEVTSGRRWTYSTASTGWIPDDLSVLDELDDVSTLTNLAQGPLAVLITTTAGANPTTVDMFNLANGAPRQSFSFPTYTEVQDITVGLDYDIAGTSGLLKLEIYRGEETGLDSSLGNFPAVQTALGDPVLVSYAIEAITAQGAAVFPFPPGNILAPNVIYTFVVRSENLDASMLLGVRDSSIDGQFGNVATQDIEFFVNGFELSGTPTTGDVLKFDLAGGSTWESGPLYPTGTFDPIQINTRDPLATDVFNSGIFWRNEVTEQCWISRGAGVWWPVPPQPFSTTPTVAVRADVAPATPTDGQLWFSNISAKLFMYDADATAWIEV
jgi:hypothetical protein